MKIYLGIILVLAFSCQERNEKYDLLFLSPKKDKKILIENQGDFTSIMVQPLNRKIEEKITILSINTEKEEIEAYWLSNEMIQIEYPIEHEITVRKDKIELFNNEISITHSPFKHAKIVNQVNANLNRATPFIKVQVGEKNYNKALMLVNKKQERLALPGSKSNGYEYGNLYVDEGNYRILIHGHYSSYSYTKYFNIPSGKKVLIELE